MATTPLAPSVPSANFVARDAAREELGKVLESMPTLEPDNGQRAPADLSQFDRLEWMWVNNIGGMTEEERDEYIMLVVKLVREERREAQS